MILTNSKENIWVLPSQETLSSLQLRPGRNYAVVLCNDFMGNSLVLFWTMCDSVKGPCDIQSINISTAHGVWLSRYRSSNSMLATDSALVLVFMNFIHGRCNRLLSKNISVIWDTITFMGLNCHTHPYFHMAYIDALSCIYIYIYTYISSSSRASGNCLWCT